MPMCVTCRCTFRGARVVIDGHLVCPDCVYELEYGPAERAPEVEYVNGEPQAERLFPIESIPLRSQPKSRARG